MNQNLLDQHQEANYKNSINSEQALNQDNFEQNQNLSSTQLYEDDAQIQQTSKDLLSRQEEIIRQFEEKLSKTVQLVKQNCTFQFGENQENNYEEQKYQPVQSNIDNNFNTSRNQFQKKNEFDIQCIQEENSECNSNATCQECQTKEQLIDTLKEKVNNLEKKLNQKEKEIEKEKQQSSQKFQDLKRNNDQLLMTIEDKYKLSFEIQKEKYEEKFQELLKQLNSREEDSNKKIVEFQQKNKKLYNLVVQLELEKSELNTKCQEIANMQQQQLQQQQSQRGLSQSRKSPSISMKSPNNQNNQIPRYKKQLAPTTTATPQRKQSIHLSNSKIQTSNKKGVNNSMFTPNENNQNYQNQISEIDITASVLQESTSSNNIINLMNKTENTINNCSQGKTINNFSARQSKKNINNNSAKKFVKEKASVPQKQGVQSKVKKYKTSINQKS